MQKKIFKQKWSLAIVAFVCMVFFMACNQPNYFYFENQDIENEVWTVNNQLPFHFTVEDTIKPYYVGFCVRYTQQYPAQNMYVFLHTTLPNGMIMHDTILTDLFYLDGSAIGKGQRIKELYNTFSPLTFPLKGKYTMRLEQAVRIDTTAIDSLKGIVSIGLYITENQVNKDGKYTQKKQTKKQ
ncbi:MAG: gliding motility lipoprotein GldH [Bacteroidales bacterium]|jgi:gliding motility-associated lipoprotein GldH|nr:gliding motility lipoprotein GldH [Bacteroidales bacterium]